MPANNSSKAEAPKMRHIGELIDTVMRDSPLLQRHIAAAAGIHPTTLSLLKGREDVSVDLLWRLCGVLRHNFFADLAAGLPADLPSFVPADDAPARRVRELEDELRIVTAERDVLLKAAAGAGGK